MTRIKATLTSGNIIRRAIYDIERELVRLTGDLPLQHWMELPCDKGCVVGEARLAHGIQQFIWFGRPFQMPPKEKPCFYIVVRQSGSTAELGGIFAGEGDALHESFFREMPEFLRGFLRRRERVDADEDAIDLALKLRIVQAKETQAKATQAKPPSVGPAKLAPGAAPRPPRTPAKKSRGKKTA